VSEERSRLFIVLLEQAGVEGKRFDESITVRLICMNGLALMMKNDGQGVKCIPRESDLDLREWPRQNRESDDIPRSILREDDM